MKTDLNEYFRKHRTPGDYTVIPRIHCADGFNLSVQVGRCLYCTPRDSQGPWSEVEVGFPSDTPEPLMQWAESPEDPTGTVYGYVPIEIVERLIDDHGGIAAKPEPKEATPCP